MGGVLRVLSVWMMLAGVASAQAGPTPGKEPASVPATLAV